MAQSEKHEHHRVCPFWVGYLLVSPLRKIIQNPGRILTRHVKPGMRVLDIGCAMGFFSLPMARLVGPEGRVICVDIQQRMLDACLRRARRGNLDDRMEMRLCTSGSLCIDGLSGQIDFALAFAVVHEASDASRLFSEAHAVLKPGSRVLVAEPRKEVAEASFEKTIAAAEAHGFHVLETPKVLRAYAAILQRNGDPGQDP